jgi:hypothetical protein
MAMLSHWETSLSGIQWGVEEEQVPHPLVASSPVLPAVLYTDLSKNVEMSLF